MTEHADQFEQACGRVEPEDDDVSNASEAHLEVRDVLAAREGLKDLGIDTILIGSYARHVAIRRVKDVDVFSKLEKLASDITSSEILDTFEEALADYGDRLERQDRSIKVDFPDFGLHVDVVPARPAGEHWEITDRPNDTGEDRWALTDPEEYGSLTTKMNERFDGNYVPVVKLLRQTRRHLLGDARPGGHFIEVLAYWTFDDMPEANEEWTRQRLYVAALRGIADRLADFRDGVGVDDPALPGHEISIRASDDEKAAAAETFATAATRAQQALDDTDVCASALVFQDLLGKNSDDEFVFELPSYCDPSGKLAANVTPASRQVSRTDGRFA